MGRWGSIRHTHGQTPRPAGQDRIKLRKEPGVVTGNVGSPGRRIQDFGPCSLLGQEPAVWTWPPALQNSLSPFQDSVCPFLLHCGVDSLSLSLPLLSSPGGLEVSAPQSTHHSWAPARGQAGCPHLSKGLDGVLPATAPFLPSPTPPTASVAGS